MRKSILRFASVIFGIALTPLPGNAANMLVFFGTHRSGPSLGFSLAHFNPITGALSQPEFLQEAEAPAFFVIHPDGKHLYTCNSMDSYQGKPGGAVSAYTIEPKTGNLALLNRKPTGGGEPSYISLDHTGRYALVANYNGGSVCVYAIQPDGGFGERTAFIQHTGSSTHPQRQKHAYAHSIIVDPGNRFALAADLGADKVFVYRFNAKDGSLVPNDPPSVSLKPGSGPRHIKFHPNGKFVYAINELSSTVTGFNWNSLTGSLTEFQSLSTLPADFNGFNTCAEIEVHPNGKFLYGTNRGHDSIAVFGIDAVTGRLTPVEHVPTRGKMPRNFAFDPTGKWILLSNHDSNNSVVFRVDDRTGMLTQTGKPVEVPDPFCERFLPLP